MRIIELPTEYIMDFNALAGDLSVDKTIQALKSKGYEAVRVRTGAEALAKIKEVIPAGASAMHGTSVTLEQIGFTAYLSSGQHAWVNLHARVRAEPDPVKRARRRREAELSDFYLGSVHALTETGEFVIASNTGSQLPHVAYTSPNLIFVVSTKKIVPTFEDGMKRLTQYVVPLEDKHMHDLYGIGTNLNKILIFRGEAKTSGRKILFILVGENLGF